MLNCELCDYFKKMNLRLDSKERCYCELTNFVFHKEVSDYKMEEHPCFYYKDGSLIHEKPAVA